MSEVIVPALQAEPVRVNTLPEKPSFQERADVKKSWPPVEKGQTFYLTEGNLPRDKYTKDSLEIPIKVSTEGYLVCLVPDCPNPQFGTRHTSAAVNAARHLRSRHLSAILVDGQAKPKRSLASTGAKGRPPPSWLNLPTGGVVGDDEEQRAKRRKALLEAGRSTVARPMQNNLRWCKPSASHWLGQVSQCCGARSLGPTESIRDQLIASKMATLEQVTETLARAQAASTSGGAADAGAGELGHDEATVSLLQRRKTNLAKEVEALLDQSPGDALRESGTWLTETSPPHGSGSHTETGVLGDPFPAAGAIGQVPTPTASV